MTSAELASIIFKQIAVSGMVIAALYAAVKGPKALLHISIGSLDSGYKNIAFAAFNTLMVVIFFGWLAYISQTLYSLGIPHLDPAIWSGLAFPVAFGLALIVFDFANYWAHRCLHSRWLWPVHRLHHSDAHMNWTTALRIHILEYVFMAVFVVALIGWLQLPWEAASLAGAVRLWHSHYLHCQLGWTHGRFAKVLASPNYHRWHHTMATEAQGKNLSDMFPIWDIAFGTHHNPGLCTDEIGVKDAQENFFGELAYPFVTWFATILGGIRRYVRPTDKTLPVPE